MDSINGLFELMAGFFILNHCRVLVKAKSVSGVSVISVVFFFVWGLWNIIYYPAIGQTFSFYAGMVVCLANALWVGLLLYYKKEGNYET